MRARRSAVLNGRARKRVVVRLAVGVEKPRPMHVSISGIRRSLIFLPIQVVIGAAVVRINVGGRVNAAAVAQVGCHGLPDMMKVRGALDRLTMTTRGRKRRQQHRDQYGDDRNYDEQLDQRERAPWLGEGPFET